MATGGRKTILMNPLDNIAPPRASRINRAGSQAGKAKAKVTEPKKAMPVSVKKTGDAPALPADKTAGRAATTRKKAVKSSVTSKASPVNPSPAPRASSARKSVTTNEAVKAKELAKAPAKEPAKESAKELATAPGKAPAKAAAKVSAAAQETAQVTAKTSPAEQSLNKDVPAAKAAVPAQSAQTVMEQALKASLGEAAAPTPAPKVVPEESPSKSAQTVQEIFEAELTAHLKPASTAPAAQPVQAVSVKKLAAMKVVKRWARWSAAFSLIPTPIIDLAAITGVQVKMIYALCRHYEVDFEHKFALAVVTGLAGGAAVQSTANLVAKQAVKAVPGLGAVFTVAIEPVLSYTTTYAMGIAFVHHFEAQGTLDDFKPESIQRYLSEQLKKGQSLFTSKDKTQRA